MNRKSPQRKKMQSRKGRFLPYNPRNWAAEPGDKMIDHLGRLFRLEESTGRNQRDTGILYPRQVPAPSGAIAVLVDGQGYWEWNTTSMKEYLLVIVLESGNLMCFDYDTKDIAERQALFFNKDGVEAGTIKHIYIGYNMNWVCPVCDGGPGNYCNCKCR